MKKTLTLMFAALLAMLPARAQILSKDSGKAINGTVVYSLPVTTITFQVDAVREDFIAGPYASYAKKYMGSEAKTANEVNYYLKSIKMVPYLEADPSLRYTAKLKGDANFLEL